MTGISCLRMNGTSRTIRSSELFSGTNITAVRYIHNNPVSAGISLAEDYKWSSYSEYIGEVPEKSRLCNTDVILNLFSSKETFIDFHRAVINADD